MPIIRSNHSFDNQYARIPNAWLRDSRLSLKSIGLLAQLMSHSPGWNVSMRSLSVSNGCGLDAIRTAVAELESAGYLKRRQERGDLGRFGETTWMTCDPSDSPWLDYPTTDNPMSGNPTPKKTSSKEEQDKEVIYRRSWSEDFILFWDTYPRKAGKQSAWKAFVKACEALGDARSIVEGARAYRDDPNRSEAFTAHPTTWLNAGRWEDDPLPERVLTAEERKAKEEADYAARKLREAELRERNRLEREAEAERLRIEREQNPVTFCEHGRVEIICTTCNPVRKQ